MKVHYAGWLENGTKFDSSVDRGQPFVFPLGNVVPPGASPVSPSLGIAAAPGTRYPRA